MRHHITCLAVSKTPDVTTPLFSCLTKRADTVGELGRVENYVSHLASLKAQDHGNAYAERLA
jgi:hypothetical protein